MSYFVFYCYLFMCKLPGFGKRELICLLSFTGEISSSSWCLGWATLSYCGTPRAFI